MKTKKLISLLTAVAIILYSLCGVCYALPSGEDSVGAELSFDCRSAILMEAETGTVLYESNADEALPPASITKVMTLLLVMEAIDKGRISLDDTARASSNACSMGGSQIYLEEGEEMTVEDLIKSVVIASANDAAVVLAEHVAGSEEAFVRMMNERARELGLKNTHFENTNGLDDTTQDHTSSARDIAIMSRELIKHKKITEYSSIWMDSIRGGQFGLTNTNRLVRFYKGATGLKTGSTAKAKFCITATAERDGMTLICVIMAAAPRDIRNAAATALLDYGFANFSLYKNTAEQLPRIKVCGGESTVCRIGYEDFVCVVGKGESSRITHSVEVRETLDAPVRAGDIAGEVVYCLDGREIGRSGIMCLEDVGRIDFFGVFLKLLSKMSIC